MKLLGVVCLVMWGLISFANVTLAADIPVGFHLLDPAELSLALPYRADEAKPLYVTVPWSIYDRRQDVWDKFFKTAADQKVIPIIRFVTKFENETWTVPSRRDIVEAVKFLSSLSWSGRRIVVLFNEPNHAAEWGGQVDPEGYAELSLFAASWLKTEPVAYEVLPAGLDNDAPTNGTMMESFKFIDRMHAAAPELFNQIDAWTSHSYPNPAFSGSVYATGKNSIRGFEMELSKLKHLTGRDYPVYITETGWKYNPQTARRLPMYYKQAMAKVWQNPNIKAITLFVLRGVNGPFAEFSLLNEDNQPTAQMRAFSAALDGN